MSLENKEASVKFDPMSVSAAEITEFINDMGFDAQLLSGGGDSAPLSMCHISQLCKDYPPSPL